MIALTQLYLAGVTMPRSDKLSGYKTTITEINLSNGNYLTVVTYHTTKIVSFDSGAIILNFGGWDTITTRRKMNQASKQFGLGYSVCRHKGETFIHYKGIAEPYNGRSIILNRHDDLMYNIQAS